jgi:hypothetical protein
MIFFRTEKHRAEYFLEDVEVREDNDFLCKLLI